MFLDGGIDDLVDHAGVELHGDVVELPIVFLRGGEIGPEFLASVPPG